VALVSPRGVVIHSSEHAARIEAGVGFEWDRLPRTVRSVDLVATDATDVSFSRDRRSQRGLHRFGAIRRLWADGVDDAFLDEIVRMPGLEVLSMQRVTAADLAPLASLPALRHLSISHSPGIGDLGWTAGLRVQALALHDLKRIVSLEPLAALGGLRALAVEGGMGAAMRVATLLPLQGLHALQALFLANLRVADRSLRPLHGLARLRELQCARWYDDGEFAALSAALPDLRCSWCVPGALERD
jgi:hypothetical protein